MAHGLDLDCRTIGANLQRRGFGSRDFACTTLHCATLWQQREAAAGLKSSHPLTKLNHFVPLLEKGTHSCFMLLCCFSSTETECKMQSEIQYSH